MFANLLGIVILALGLLVSIIALALYFNWIKKGKQQLLILIGSLLGLMILLMIVLFTVWN